MLAYYVHDLSPFLWEFGDGVGLRWYGLAYVMAFVAAYGITLHLARVGYSDLKPAQVGDFVTGVAFFGVILGGRLGYMLLYDWGQFSANPLVFFKFWDGGMSSHGGMIGVMGFTWVYARKQHMSWLNLGDNLVVAAPVGLFLGRCANFVNGELFGRVVTVPWAVQFPKELYSAPAETVQLALIEAARIDPGWVSIGEIVENARVSRPLREQLAGTLSPRHPSQIYEALLEGAVLFGLLWILRTHFRLRDGVLTGVFFIAYAVLRIVGEMFREPDAPMIGAFTRGQFFSLFLIAIGVGFLTIARRRADRGTEDV